MIVGLRVNIPQVLGCVGGGVHSQKGPKRRPGLIPSHCPSEVGFAGYLRMKKVVKQVIHQRTQRKGQSLGRMSQTRQNKGGWVFALGPTTPVRIPRHLGFRDSGDSALQM